MKKKIVIALIALFLLFGNFSGKIEAFSDVPNHTYYADAIKDLANRNIINGFPDGTFRPNEKITRGQVAALVAKSLNLKPDNSTTLTFSDVPSTHYFYPYITALAQLKIINGYTNGKFGVNDTMTRGQAAKVLTLAYSLLEGNTVNTPFTDISTTMFAPYIETLYAHRITNGLTKTRYGPNDSLTRGSVAVLIQRLEQVKRNEQTVITYDQLNANSVDVSYEYQETNDLIAVYNDKLNRKIIITPLKAGHSTLLFTITTKSGEKTLKKYELNLVAIQNQLTAKLSETTEIEAAQFTFSSNELDFIPNLVKVTRANGNETKTVDIKQGANQYTFDFYAAGNYIIAFSNGSKIERVKVQLTLNNYALSGTATFESAKLVVQEAQLGVKIENNNAMLEKDYTNSTPVTLTQAKGKIILKPIATGSTYLKVTQGKNSTYYIIEVVKVDGEYIINLYEAK